MSVRITFILLACCVFSATGHAVTYSELEIPDKSGVVITVQGDVSPDDLGMTLMHEHLFTENYALPIDSPHKWDIADGREYPVTKKELDAYHQKFTIEDRGLMLQNLLTNKDGLDLDSESDMKAEALAYKKVGGNTIVDVTPIGIGRDPNKLQGLSKATGLHVVMGTGFYQEAWHPAYIADYSVANFVDLMVREIVVGVGSSGIRAGIIGEVPAERISFSPDSPEVKVLRAAARVSRLTGAAISLHADITSGEDLIRSLDLLEKEGADLTRVIVGHAMGENHTSIEYLRSLLAKGVCLEFDMLGWPFLINNSYLDGRPMIDVIEKLISLGYSSQMLVSHDVASKYQLTKNGGHGYTFVHGTLLPYLKKRGVSEKAIKNIFIDNPKRLLTFVKPKAL